jgi:hypothetical protein
MDHVFKSWQHKSKLKETVIGPLFLFHQGKCLTTISFSQTSPTAIEFDAYIVMPCGNSFHCIPSITDKSVGDNRYHTNCCLVQMN